MDYDKGSLKVEKHTLEQVRDKLCEYLLSHKAADDEMEISAANHAYEGFADGINYMSHITRFIQLEEILSGVHSHVHNISILNDCIQQVIDELSEHIPEDQRNDKHGPSEPHGSSSTCQP